MAKTFGSLVWPLLSANLVLFALLVQPGDVYAADRGSALKALVDENADLVRELKRPEQAGSSDEPGEKRHEIYTERSRLQSEAVELYRQAPGDAVAFDAMLFATYADYNQLSDEICRYLKQYHLDNPRLYLTLSTRQQFQHGYTSDDCEQFYKAAAAGGSTARVREIAQLRLALTYQKMAGLLANLGELEMSPENYFTSESRSIHGPLPAQTMERIRKKYAQSTWATRKWQPLRQRARQLAGSVQDSEYSLSFYTFDENGFHETKGTPISKEAARIVYRIDHASPGTHIVDFGATDLEGNPVSFARHRGKIIVLELWASWYKPCIKSIPRLRAMQERMRGRPFEIITLSLDANVGDAKVFMQDNPMPFTNWYIGEDHEFLNTWQVWPLPKRYIVDQNGVIRSIPRLGFDDFANYLNRLVAEASEENGQPADDERQSRPLEHSR